MPSEKKRKTAPSNEQILDSFESWLKRQKPTNVKARAGYTSGEKEE